MLDIFIVFPVAKIDIASCPLCGRLNYRAKNVKQKSDGDANRKRYRYDNYGDGFFH